MPAQNARPAPVTTTARTSSARASVRKNLSSSRAMVRSNALSWSGPVQGQRRHAVVVDATERVS